MFTDQPINTDSEDQLGRTPISREIANGLLKSFANNSDSVVIGINGEWGSGKSSLINLIVAQIEAKSQNDVSEALVLRFNPWMFSGQTELQGIFFAELLLLLQGKTEKLKNVSEGLSDFLDHFNWIKYFHQGAAEAIKDSQDFLSKINKKQSLVDLKKKIDGLLISNGVKLYIAIDDIDRLTPVEITNIFQLVKLNGNFSNTIFILAYDREVVASALEKQFGENGDRYLEKIVQIDYTLPNPSRKQIQDIFSRTFSALFSEPELSELIVKSITDLRTDKFTELFRSIRDVYRFNNGIKLRLPSIYNDLNIRDFLLIEALRLFRPKAYKFIIDNKERLTNPSKNERIIILKRKMESESVSQLIDKSGLDELSREIISCIFELEGNFVFSTLSPDDLIREKRAANRNYFDRYFNLQLSTTDIPEQLFIDFISTADQSKQLEILDKVHQEQKLYEFTNWVDIKAAYLGVSSVPILTSALRFCDKLKYNFEGLRYDSELMTMLRFSSRRLNRIKDIQEKKQIIKNYIQRDKSSVSFASVYTCMSILQSKELADSDNLQVGHMWYDLFLDASLGNVDDPGFFKLVEATFGNGITYLFNSCIKDHLLFNQDELFFILRKFEYYDSNLYSKKFKKLLNDDSALLRILNACILSTYVNMGGDVGYSLGKSQFLNGMDPKKIGRRINAMNRKAFDGMQTATIDFFLRAEKDGFKEKKYYHFKSLEELKIPS
jgi:KAP family P-loop domain